jgi:hypothetical protein
MDSRSVLDNSLDSTVDEFHRAVEDEEKVTVNTVLKINNKIIPHLEKNVFTKQSKLFLKIFSSN